MPGEPYAWAKKDDRIRECRAVDLPPRTRDFPLARDEFPANLHYNWAKIPQPKFQDYSVDPGHTDSHGRPTGKALGWEAPAPDDGVGTTAPRQGDALMVQENDAVRLTAEKPDHRSSRTVPAGTEGTVIYVLGEECLVEVTFAPQTPESDGDFGEIYAGPGEYEVLDPRDTGFIELPFQE